MRQKIQCNKCEKVFKKTSQLKQHMDRKTPCVPLQEDPTKNTADATCQYCRKILSSTYAVKKHHITCKIKNYDIRTLLGEFKKLKEKDRKNKIENQRMAAEIKELKSLLKAAPAPKIKGCVYFVQMEDSDMYKIGYTSKDAKSRLSQLQVGCPFTLTVRDFIPVADPKRFESYMHECFETKKVRGEWFKLTADDVDTLVAHVKGYSIVI